jgi:predicted acylesterase/phospholipase RssA
VSRCLARSGAWIPYFAISTNLSSYEQHCHRRGELWTAVRATGSIPVVLPPFFTDEGHMLVDGCLLDNVPIAAMHQMKRGPNIIISLHVPTLECYDVSYSALPSRWDLVRGFINPLRRKPLPQAPGPITVLLRSLESRRDDYTRHMRPGDLLLTLRCQPTWVFSIGTVIPNSWRRPIGGHRVRSPDCRRRRILPLPRQRLSISSDILRTTCWKKRSLRADAR